LQRTPSGNPHAILEINRDVTARRHAEAQRDELLQREQAARAAAEASSRAKDEFLAMLGHELRNPLAPILTALELMRLKAAPGMFERERDVIDRQVRHLVRLVDDLLDVSRITRGKVELRKEVVEMFGVVQRAVEMATPLLEQRQHRLDIQVAETGLQVLADAARLEQVLANLLTNAAKYTPEGGRIRVLGRKVQGHIEVAIEDNGVGIAPTLLPKIFDVFVQGERTIERSEGGLGLGLAIVKSLVQLHGGSVVAHSEGVGRGSVFQVRLAECANAPSADRHEPVDLEHGERKVLVVDDNIDAAELLADALSSLGYRVATAHDGPAAISQAERFVPHTILLDIGLPVMDGYEVARRVRALPALAQTHLIAITGYGQRTDLLQSQAAGFDLHIVKPVDLDALHEAIQVRRQQWSRPS
jgi:CheY-like chemotaxis protein